VKKLFILISFFGFLAAWNPSNPITPNTVQGITPIPFIIFVILGFLFILVPFGAGGDPALIPLILVDGVGYGGADHNLYRLGRVVEATIDSPLSPYYQYGY